MTTMTMTVNSVAQAVILRFRLAMPKSKDFISIKETKFQMILNIIYKDSYWEDTITFDKKRDNGFSQGYMMGQNRHYGIIESGLVIREDSTEKDFQEFLDDVDKILGL